MNFRQIDIFLDITKTYNFSRTADNLFLSQSTVSKQIAALEKETGEVLLQRSSYSGVQLTPAGEIYRDAFLRMREELNTARKKTQRLRGSIFGTLRIGILSGWDISTHVLPFLDRFQREYPNISLQIDIADMEPLRESVLEGKQDIILTIADSLQITNDLVQIEFGRPRRILLYSDRLGLNTAEQPDPDVSMFSDAVFLCVSDKKMGSSNIIRDYLKCYGIEPKVLFLPSIESTISYCHSGKGVVILDDWSREIHNLSFHHVLLNSSNKAVWAAKKTLHSETADCFMRMIGA